VAISVYSANDPKASNGDLTYNPFIGMA